MIRLLSDNKMRTPQEAGEKYNMVGSLYNSTSKQLSPVTNTLVDTRKSTPQTHCRKQAEQSTKPGLPRDGISQRQRKTVIGTCDDIKDQNEFEASNKMLWIYVGKCKPYSTIEGVREYLKKNLQVMNLWWKICSHKEGIRHTK